MKALLLFAALCVACYAGPTQDIPGDKQPAADTILTLSKEPATSGKIIILPNSTGDWIPVTLQEAQDVVKAMEIALWTPKHVEGLVARLVDERVKAKKFEISEAEATAIVQEERDKEHAWARSILELWRKKVEAFK